MTKEQIMKKLLLIVMALVAMQVTAQEQRREHKQRDKQERSQRFKDFTPEQIATSINQTTDFKAAVVEIG